MHTHTISVRDNIMDTNENSGAYHDWPTLQIHIHMSTQRWSSLYLSGLAHRIAKDLIYTVLLGSIGLLYSFLYQNMFNTFENIPYD